MVIRSVDGRLHGFNAQSGKELWSVEQQVPRLSLRGTATPIIAKEVAISGFDNGKVMAVSLNTGDTVWDTALASPHGRTELDRLVDIDSAVRVVGDNVFAAGIPRAHGDAGARFGPDLVGTRMSSYRGLAVDDENLYVTQSDGIVVALRQRDGSELWRNQKMRLRRLSTPVLTSTAVAVADFQGYVHWLDKTTGELVARERIAKERVTNPPVAVRRYRGRAERRRQVGGVPRDARRGRRCRCVPAAPAATPAAAAAAPAAPAAPATADAAPDAPAAGRRASRRESRDSSAHT